MFKILLGIAGVVGFFAGLLGEAMKKLQQRTRILGQKVQETQRPADEGTMIWYWWGKLQLRE